MLCMFYLGTAHSEIDKKYLSELVEISQGLKLYERPEWHKLIHYVPALFDSRFTGLVDSHNFYLSADGKRNPQSELEATLESFFSEEEETSKSQHPQCAFIARYTWLNEQLGFNEARMSHRACTRYERWYKDLNPEALTLVFASAYLNSPSSMYGHTFLRIDAQDQDDKTRLLAYAVNFAANTQETNGITFAVNGLFGGYPGTFSMMPYYAKVLEYSDFENRDLWEYRLNLNSKEIERVLQHAWELGPNYFEYYFFDENCAYQLLGLLQVARPELDLTGQFRWGTIPVDTVRALSTEHSMVAGTVYRPSNATIIRNNLAAMNARERDMVSALSRGKIKITDYPIRDFDKQRMAAVIETSQDYVSYRNAIGKQDISDSMVLVHELQSARSRLDIVTQPADTHEPKAKPDDGHRSSRLDVSTGRREKANFQQLRLRATYHDLMDREDGFVRGAEIEFLSFAVRHYDLGVTRVESMMPVSILSLSPRDQFFHSPSWRVSGGWKRVATVSGAEPLATVVDGGIGAAWSDQRNSKLTYALLDTSGSFHSAIDKGCAIGMGPHIGAYIDINEDLRMHSYMRATRSFIGQIDTKQNIGIELRYSLNKNLALRIDGARNSELGLRFSTASVAMMVYF